MNRLLLTAAPFLVLVACGGQQAEPQAPAPGDPPPANAANATSPPSSSSPSSPSAPSSSSSPSSPSSSSLPVPATPATFAEQVALGQKLYGENCASCHGSSGSDGKAPKVVGLKTGALPLDPPATSKYRKTQFKTVADVADFVVRSMPPNKAGSLTEEQYWAILAFDLKANGIDLGDKKLGPSLAATLTIPR